jgi:hypothetical protein
MTASQINCMLPGVYPNGTTRTNRAWLQAPGPALLNQFAGRRQFLER